MDNVVAAHFQSPQQSGQHRGGLRLGVVQQDDAAPNVVDAGEEQLQLGLGPHRQPVAGPDVGAEHDDAAPLQAVEQRLARGKAGEPEKWCRRFAARPAIGGQFVAGDAAVDFGLGFVERQMVEQGVRVCVVADRVALGQRPPHDLRMRVGVAAQQKERGADAFRFQGIEHPRRGGWPGTVVEGQDQFLVAQRQGIGEMLAPDPRGGACIDRDHPLGAEGIAIAGTRLRARGRRHEGHKRSQHRGGKKTNHREHPCHDLRGI